MDQELIEYLDRRFTQFKDELRADLRGDIAASAADLRADLRAEIAASAEETRRHVDATTTDTRRHFDVVAEQLISKIQLVAEGVVLVNQKVDRLADQMHDQFRAGGPPLPPSPRSDPSPPVMHLDAVSWRVDSRRMGQQLPEGPNPSLDDSRTPIGDEAAKLCAHIQAFAERLKPGRFLRYLEARAAEVADLAGVEAGSKRSVVYAVPRLDRDEAGR